MQANRQSKDPEQRLVVPPDRPRAVAERASGRYAFGANLATYGGSALLLIALAITGFRHGFALFVAGFFVGGLVSAFAAYVAYDQWVQRGLP